MYTRRSRRGVISATVGSLAIIGAVLIALIVLLWPDPGAPGSGATIILRNQKINQFADWARINLGATEEQIDDFLEDFHEQNGLGAYPAILTPGDADHDFDIDFDDYLQLQGNYGAATPGWSNIHNAWTSGDFDLDGVVGFSDFLALQDNWNP